ncbi:potassium voltage-gated channel unc-103-like [Achroia grisella]|uniref:potassium voltage-gated channel unc-103-like n=1 Tax=Achroia grisella TaxID=688607 RepID=UPI0027D22237|nr:potassium voltage-gated channel unc-103-like [Achroia grisella]
MKEKGSPINLNSRVIDEIRSNKIKDSVNFQGYFQGHHCHLPVDKLSVYNIKCSKFRRFFFNLSTVRMGDIRARNLYRSYTALCAEKYRHFLYYPYAIHPYSKLRLWLEAVFVVAILISNTALAFHYSEDYPAHSDYHTDISFVTDIITMLNIIINIFTGYIEGKTCQYAVLDFKKLLCHYAKTWMTVDLLSALSFLPIVIHIEDTTPILILVAMKMLRVPIMLKYIGNVMTVMRINFVVRTCVEIFLFIFSYLTWNIYFQFAVEYIAEGTFKPTDPRTCSWIYMGKLWNATTIVRFTYAWERAVSMLRKNSNLNLIDTNGCFEYFFMISWFIAKLLVYHCALKFIIAVFGTESAKAQYFTMIKQVEMYMNQRKFPPRIKKKILKFYAIRFQSNFFVESRIHACVSGQLREDIIMHTGRQLVGELEFLKQLPRSLHVQICMKLKMVIFIAGDIIFKINTIGDCLYFIDKGTVAIYSESGREVCHLEDGDFFGEIALVMKHRLRTASAVAVTNCELFRLGREDFESSIACYPTVYEDIKRVATFRYERTCVLDEHHKTELKTPEELKTQK